jgi:hypothetical protein
MSCGNRFQCGLSKATRFSFQPDKPSNPELFNENQKKLNDLLKAREQMDKAFSQTTPSNKDDSQNKISSMSSMVLYNVDKVSVAEEINTVESNKYTPWKIPSSQDFIIRK